MAVTVLSMLLVMVAVWGSGAQAQCDFDKVVPMKNFDINQFKGRWYVSHKSNVPDNFKDVTLQYGDITNVTPTSASVKVHLFYADGSCREMPIDVIVKNATLSGGSGLLAENVFRIMATDP